MPSSGSVWAHVAAAVAVTRLVLPDVAGRAIDAAAVAVVNDALADGTPLTVYRRRWAARSSPLDGNGGLAATVASMGAAATVGVMGGGGALALVPTTTMTTTTTTTIVLLHGMAASGAADPRLVRLAGALALAGHPVVMPTVAGLVRCEVDGGTVTVVAAVVAGIRGLLAMAGARVCSAAAVAEGTGDANRRGRYVAPSSASPIGGVLLVGAHASVGTVFEWAFFSPTADPYARTAMLLNALPLMPPQLVAAAVTAAAAAANAAANADTVNAAHTPTAADVAGARTLLRATLHDDHHRRPAELPAALAAATTGAARVYAALTSPAGWARVGRDLPATTAYRTFASALSPVGAVVPALRARAVVLLHGEDDAVVPPAETAAFAAHLRSGRGGEEGEGAGGGLPVVHTLVSPLLGHGDRRGISQTGTALVALVRAFAVFFEAASGRSGRGSLQSGP
ncbi:hypothetical protein MMPV_003931 [Pyropia vietnamensis]